MLISNLQYPDLPLPDQICGQEGYPAYLLADLAVLGHLADHIRAVAGDEGAAIDIESRAAGHHGRLLVPAIPVEQFSESGGVVEFIINRVYNLIIIVGF